MKKAVLSLIMMLIMVSGSNGAVSEDMSVYVRKDVFEVYMQNINTNMERILQKLDKLDSFEATLTAKIEETNRRIDRVNTQIGDLSFHNFRNDINFLMAIVGVLVFLSVIVQIHESIKKHKRE